MNTFPSKKTDTGWILCPSKSFPGKFYYFNVTTGETAWCLNETEKKLLKDPPVQRADHGYPEPNSPPAEEIEPAYNYQRIINATQNHERSILGYLKKTQHAAQNISNVSVRPFNQISKSVPCQIQLPMIWLNEAQIPQIVMIVMNQGMSQLTLDEPEQGFRQPNQRFGFKPNQILEPNRAWQEPNQISESNQAWQEANYYLERNQAWNEPNQVLDEPKEPDRELFVQSGKAPLCERFMNFQKPVIEIKNNQIVNPNTYDSHTNNEFDVSSRNQHDLSPKKAYIPTYSFNKSIENPWPSNLNQNQQKTSPCKGKEKIQNSYLNIAKKYPETIENTSVFMPGPNNYQNSNQKVSKFGQGLFRQSQVKQNFGQIQTKQLFGDSQKNQRHFGQSQTNKELFGKTQTKPLYEQTQTKPLFGQRQTNNDLFGQGQSKHNPFGQHQSNHGLFGQSVTNKNPFLPNKTCSEISQSSPNSNPFQKFITEKSTLKPNAKVDFSKSSQINAELPPCFKEKHATNAKGKSALTLNNKAENSQEADLDKNDLRRVLMDKKRKSNVLATTGSIVEAKKTKTNMQGNTTVATPTKKVTFNLEPECFSLSDIVEDSYKETEYQGLSPPSNESWYVITDAATLLENFDVLDSFVKSDPSCNLMIPSGVMSDIVALSRGECRERELVTLARHLLRALATPQPHIVVQQSSDVSPKVSTDDSILNLCLEIVDEAYVALITNDEDLRTTAEYLNINCFTLDHIKNGQAKKAEVHFDVKKIKISITNKPEIESTTRKFERLSFKSGDSTLNKNNSSQNYFEPNSYDQQTERDKINQNLKIHNQPQSSTYSQTEKTKEETSSIFKQANDRPPQKTQCSIFEREKYENRATQSQPSIFDKEKYENRQAQTQPQIFDKENNTNKENLSTLNIEACKNIENQTRSSIFNAKPSENQKKPPIFDAETKTNQPQPISEKQDVADVKNKYLEQFLKTFCEKNAGIERLVEERRDEICCSFRQIMEECLNDILQGQANVLKQKLGSSPPWTLIEALQCMLCVYENHSYIRDVVAVFTRVLNAKGDVAVTDVIRTIGCGVALVKYLTFIKPTLEVLKDTEESLNTVLNNMFGSTDIPLEAPSMPQASHADEKKLKCDYFVKDRSEVLKYLKKHFPAWADYNETLKENTSEVTWGMNHEYKKIIRTSGKNLGNLKLTNSKPMIFEIEPNSQHTENKPKINQEQENAQNNLNIENDKTQKMDIENVTQNENVTKNKLNVKLTRTVNNTKENIQKPTSVSIEENQVNHTEPKVVRLLNNIDVNKDSKNKTQEKPVLDDFSTHGHTFGRTQNGPKIIRNIKPIKAFEKKMEKKPLNLDELDYSVMSDDTNINCLSMSIENNEDPAQKLCLAPKNDSHVKNDRDATNDSRNNNDTATNNGNAINLGCATNNIYNMDLDEICTTNDVTHSTYYNDFDTGFDSNIIGCEKNDDYVTDAKNDVFKRLDLYDVSNDMMQKDDATNDSGFENASQEAYYVMDTLLADLKVAFKAMHVFLGDSVNELRRGELSASTHHIIRDTAKKTHANLDKIIENLGGIIHRETFTGPKLKELVGTAGSSPVNDDRINIYGEIVTKCYDHARLIDKGVKAFLDVIDGRKC